VFVPIQDKRRAVIDWDFDERQIMGHLGTDICFWDVSSGKLLHKVPTSPTERGFEREDYAFQWNDLSPNGLQGVTSFYTGPESEESLPRQEPSCLIWDTVKGLKVCALSRQTHAVYSPDGKLLATFVKRGTGPSPYDAQIFDASTLKVLGHFMLGTLPERSSLQFSPSNKFILWTMTVPGLDLYECPSGSKVTGTQLSVSAPPSYSRFINGDDQIAAVSMKGDISLWQNKQAPAKKLDFQDRNVIEQYVTKDGLKALAIGPGLVQLRNLHDGQVFQAQVPFSYTTPHRGNSYSNLLVSPTDQTCALYQENTINKTGTVTFFSMTDLTQLGQVDVGGARAPIGFSRDGRVFLVGGPECSAYDASSGKLIRIFTLEGFKEGRTASIVAGRFRT
jgi:hypothetical protein